MPQPRDSTGGLEVDQAGIEVDKRGLEERGGKEVAYGAAPEWDANKTEKEAYNDSGLLPEESLEKRDPDLTNTEIGSTKIFGLRRRNFIICCVLGVAAIIGIAVGVGVGVSTSQANRSATPAQR